MAWIGIGSEETRHVFYALKGNYCWLKTLCAMVDEGPQAYHLNEATEYLESCINSLISALK